MAVLVPVSVVVATNVSAAKTQLAVIICPVKRLGGAIAGRIAFAHIIAQAPKYIPEITGLIFV
ncbi:hypothetical protein NBRC116494_25200 [Aurantivibrio plasticivorans]